MVVSLDAWWVKVLFRARRVVRFGTRELQANCHVISLLLRASEDVPQADGFPDVTPASFLRLHFHTREATLALLRGAVVADIASRSQLFEYDLS